VDKIRRRDATLMGVLLVAGCAGMPGKQSVKEFSDALKAMTEKFDNVVSQLSLIERDQSLEEGNREFLQPRRPGTPFAARLPAEAAPNATAANRALGDILRVLATYAANLSALVEGTDLAAAQAAVKAAATQAGTTVRQLGGVSQEEASRIVSVFALIANKALEVQTAAAVVTVVRRVQPDIEQVAAFLNTKVVGQGGDGMVAAAAINGQAASNFLALSLGEIRNDRSVNTWQRDQAYRAAAQLHRRYRVAQQVPAALRGAIEKMVLAHGALVDPPTAGPSVEDFTRAVNFVADLVNAASPPASRSN
jgi:hypothetical protein